MLRLCLRRSAAAAATVVVLAPALRGQTGRAPSTAPADTTLRALVVALGSHEPATRGEARHRLRALGPGAAGMIPALVRLAEDRRVEQRLVAVELIGATGSTAPEAITVLARALADSEPAVQSEALTWVSLRRRAARDAAAALAPLLSHRDAAVRARAVAALGNVGVSEHTLPRVLALLEDPNAQVREDAAYALRDGPRPDLVIPRLAAAAADSGNADGVNAVIALGQIGHAAPDAAVPALVRVLEGRRADWIKAEVARALGHIGRPAAGAAPALVPLLSARDASVRAAAAWALNAVIGRGGEGEGTCRHRPTAGPLPVVFHLEAGGTLQGDGAGPYRHRERGVQSSHGTSYNLQLRPPGDSRAARALVVDLSQPVPGSGAVPLGQIRDPAGRFHAFYMRDSGRVIWNTRDVPVGATVLSDRTQMNFAIDGAPHLLQLGPWGLGDCGEAYAFGSRVHGAGTTQARIARPSDARLVVTAPAGSVARLWDLRDPAAPADRGLYYVQFRASLETPQ